MGNSTSKKVEEEPKPSLPLPLPLPLPFRDTNESDTKKPSPRRLPAVVTAPTHASVSSETSLVLRGLNRDCRPDSASALPAGMTFRISKGNLTTFVRLQDIRNLDPRKVAITSELGVTERFTATGSYDVPNRTYTAGGRWKGGANQLQLTWASDDQKFWWQWKNQLTPDRQLTLQGAHGKLHHARLNMDIGHDMMLEPAYNFLTESPTFGVTKLYRNTVLNASYDINQQTASAFCSLWPMTVMVSAPISPTKGFQGKPSISAFCELGWGI